MIIGLGAIGLTIGLCLWDMKKKKQNKSIKERRTIKICLTGGPCGGKSQGVRFLSKKLKEFDVPCFVIPQAASIMSEFGFNFAEYSQEQIFYYQIYLLRLQINLEDIGSSLAHRLQKKYGKKAVLLCDRGLLDGKAYAHQKNWSGMLKKLNLSEQQMLYRYEGIIHLTTAADGADSFYVKNNVRKQDIDLAIKLDREIKKNYEKHLFHYIVPNNVTVHNFEEKKKCLWTIAHQIIIQHVDTHDIIKYYKR